MRSARPVDERDGDAARSAGMAQSEAERDDAAAAAERGLLREGFGPRAYIG